MTPARRNSLAAAALVAVCILAGLCKYLAVAPPDKDEKAAVPFPTIGEAKPDLDMAAEWNTYHGGASLTGVAPSTLPGRLQPYWRFDAGAEVYNTPVVAKGRVFFANDNGQVFATDLCGLELWSKQLTSGTRPDGTPRQAYLDAPLACFDGLLYVADGDGLLLALNTTDGEERWRHDIGAPILGTPNWSPHAAEGAPAGSTSLYVIAQDEGALHCLDAKTGEAYWTSEAVSRCDGSPGVGGGMAIFGSCDSALHFFSASTGKLERNVAIDDDAQVASGVAIEGASAISGCRSGAVLNINLQNGETLWTSHPTDYEIFSTPAVTPQWVLLAAEDGFFYALDRATGEVRWKYDTRGEALSPVIAGNKMVAAADGTLYVFDLADGRPLWSYEVSDFITSPAIAGPLVIVGCGDGTVAAFYGGEHWGSTLHENRYQDILHSSLWNELSALLWIC